MLLEVTGIAKHYDILGAEDKSLVEPMSPAEDISLVLRDIGFELDAGESLAVTGPSGSGKTTLLNIIGGLDYPSRGHVLFDGVDVHQLKEAALARLRNQKIGFVFQLHHLLPQCSVLENVLIPTLARADRADRRATRERAYGLLVRVGLEDRVSYMPGQLSVGQRQRVAVARALINQPELLLADEPTGSLDEAASAKLIDLLLELQQSDQVAMIVVTHAEEVARRMHHRYRLHDGTFVPED